jgi:pimeloyl-ACP methyl ester carboxylesterase
MNGSSIALPGYIAPPTDASDVRHAPTLLMIGGGDTFVEDLYYYIVPPANRRGYRVVFVDLPGQGGLPWNGLPMEAEAERPVAAVIDALERGSDIDLDQLAVYGISGGGYLAPRAAAHEPRIRALVACSIILDIEAVWSRRLMKLSSSLLGVCLRVVYPTFFRAIMNQVDTYRWRWGARTSEELLKASEPFKIDPASIRCPTLNLVAQQECEDFGASRRWAERCQNEIANDQRLLVVTPQAEGADAHAIGTNLSLMSHLVFDWLDEVLDRD